MKYSKEDWAKWGGQFGWHLLDADDNTARFMLIDFESDGVYETVIIPRAVRVDIDRVFGRNPELQSGPECPRLSS